MFQIDAEKKDSLVSELWETGTSGILEDADGLRAFFDDSVELCEIAALPGCKEATMRREDSVTPASNTEQWDPIMIGRHFYIGPPGLAEHELASRARLRIDAGAAFGTGRHESTQLCIEALERFLQPGDTVLDVGSGSGILALAATALHAGAVHSCDIDFNSIATARRHIESPLFMGSADAVCDSAADITLANISARVIDRLAFDLNRVTKAGGLLLLAGFIHERVPLRFEPEEVLERGDWLCWICRPVHAFEPQTAEALSHTAEWWL